MKLINTLIISLICSSITTPAFSYEDHKHETTTSIKTSDKELKKEQIFLTNIKQITIDGEKNGEAYFSPDGREIIFQGIRKGDKFYQIYKMDNKGNNIKLISTGKGKTTCSYFSPNGKKIIYASSHLDPESEKKMPTKHGSYSWDFEKSMDIFEANPDGTDLKRLTNAEGYDAEGTYSHDGKKIVFTSQRDNDSELYIMDSDGKNQKRLTNYKGYDGGAFFSPDDKKIVYRRFDKYGNAQIVLMNSDGTNVKELTGSKAINWCPAFHPDGKHIVFSSNISGRRNFDLFIMDYNGNNIKQITFDKNSDVLPIFSPDGSKLMWTSTRKDGKSQIFIADFNNKELKLEDKYNKNIYNDIKFLASDSLQGRRAGTIGADKASEYIANQFSKIGLKKGNNNSYFQSFDITTGINLTDNNSFDIENDKAELNKDFVPLSFSDNGNISGDLVFTGYGISAPEYNYDDYKNIDVKDKIVVVLRHEPQEKEVNSKFNGNKPTQYSELRYKVFTAKSKGAKALILVNGELNYNEKDDELIQLKSFGGTGNLGIPVIHVKNTFMKKYFNLKEAQENIDKTFKPNSFSLNNSDHLGNSISKKSTIKVDLKKEYKSTNNVIAFIEGTDKKLKDEVILIGAHYDHLGLGGNESLSDSKKDEVHNGADDNASGTASMIEIARQLKNYKPKRTIAFMAFSGEELGLLGSSYFTSNPTLKNIIAMLNMDMVGRLNEDKLSIGGIKTATNFESVVKSLNSKYKFKMSFFNDGYGPSDHMAFYLKNIPVLFFFTGIHDDYHRPSDDTYKINFLGINKIVDFVKDITLRIDNNNEKPKLVKIAPSPNMSSSSSGKSNGAYLGTIPDYTSMNSNTGVKISGVREGSPAEKGGLKSEDVIIKFDDIKINTIYDYTYAIKSKKPGDKILITVIRNGKENKFEVIAGKK
jgi:Tol biopolymer transport system component